MPVFSKNQKNVLFVHVPKTGGSSVEAIAKSLGWRESFSVRRRPLSEVRMYRATPQHLHAEILEGIFDLSEFDEVLMLVRNPFDRFKSEYYWQLEQGITRHPPEVWIRETLDLFKSNRYIYDNHIRPQIEFLPRSREISIFKLEDDGVQRAENLFNKIGFDRRIDYFKKAYASLRRQARHEKRTKKSKLVDSVFIENRKQIESFYVEDYKSFGYKI